MATATDRLERAEPLTEVVDAVTQAETRLRRLRDDSSLPPELDRRWVDEWLHRGYLGTGRISSIRPDVVAVGTHGTGTGTGIGVTVMPARAVAPLYKTAERDRLVADFRLRLWPVIPIAATVTDLAGA